MTKEFRPGVYRHYKGDLYCALFLVQDSTNRDCGDLAGAQQSSEEPCVVYVALSGEHAGNKCVRTLDQWNEWVPSSSVAVPRFTFLHD
jgi:hypothetical protein